MAYLETFVKSGIFALNSTPSGFSVVCSSSNTRHDPAPLGAQRLDSRTKVGRPSKVRTAGHGTRSRVTLFRHTRKGYHMMVLRFCVGDFASPVISLAGI